MAPLAAAEDPDAPVVVMGPGAAADKLATPIAAESTVDDPVREAIRNLSMHWQREILVTLEIKTLPCRSSSRCSPHPLCTPIVYTAYHPHAHTHSHFNPPHLYL